LSSVLKENLRSAVAIPWVITVNKRFDTFLQAEGFMNFIPEFARAQSMYYDHRRKAVNGSQVEILFKGLQLKGEDLEIIESLPFFD
jgi:hypothetical protein